MILMSFFEMNIAAMLVGFVLDLIIGDPEGWTHPVIWIGKWISFVEKRLRKRGGNLRRSALVLTASTVLIAMAATAAMLGILALIHKAALFIGMCIISWWCLSAKCLAVEANGVGESGHGVYLLFDSEAVCHRPVPVAAAGFPGGVVMFALPPGKVNG